MRFVFGVIAALIVGALATNHSTLARAPEPPKKEFGQKTQTTIQESPKKGLLQKGKEKVKTTFFLKKEKFHDAKDEQKGMPPQKSKSLSAESSSQGICQKIRDATTGKLIEVCTRKVTKMVLKQAAKNKDTLRQSAEELAKDQTKQNLGAGASIPPPQRSDNPFVRGMQSALNSPKGQKYTQEITTAVQEGATAGVKAGTKESVQYWVAPQPSDPKRVAEMRKLIDEID